MDDSLVEYRIRYRGMNGWEFLRDGRRRVHTYTTESHARTQARRHAQTNSGLDFEIVRVDMHITLVESLWQPI